MRDWNKICGSNPFGEFEGRIRCMGAAIQRVYRIIEEQNRTKRPRLSIKIRQLQIISCPNRATRRFKIRKHPGAGCSAREDGLIWREIETTFESHILTGVIINSNHIESHQFLEDAKSLFLLILMRLYS